jgi:hypothetical protein
MLKKKSSWLIAASLGVTGGLLPQGLPAAQFDGSSNLICAATDVVGCVDGSACLQGQARAFELPEFMAIDFQQKVVRATDETGRKEVSPIKNIEQTGTQLILQGIENGHGWSIAVDQNTGRMTTLASGEDLGFIIFGACTAL